MVISTGLKILYSFLYRKIINHIHFLYFLLLPSTISDLCLVWYIFQSCLLVSICSLFPGIFALLLYLYMNCTEIKVTPLHCTSLPFFLYLVFNSFLHVSLCLVPDRCDVVHNYSLNFFPSFTPPLVSSTSHTSVYICSIYIFAWIWLYILYMRENMWPLAFWTWLTSVKMMASSSIHLSTNGKKMSSSLWLNKIPLYINTRFS
jgi:hypothetical protein